MKRVFFVLALLAPFAGVACDKSGAEAQREADKAQQNATTKITNAQVEADKEAAKAQAEANEKSEKAQAEANEKISAADKDFMKSREDYRHTAQSHLTDVDKKLADLDAKATKGEKVKADLTGLHAERNAFANDIDSLDRTTASNWDATKARLDKEWKDLKRAVDRAK